MAREARRRELRRWLYNYVFSGFFPDFLNADQMTKAERYVVIRIGERPNPSRPVKRKHKRTLFQTAVLVLLTGGLGGCIGAGPKERPAAPQPPPCASRIPATKKIWSGVSQGTEDQVSACFASYPDEGMFITVFRSVFVCSMIPVTPPVFAAFAIVFTPLTVPFDLAETYGCAEIGAPKPVSTAQEAVTPDRQSPGEQSAIVP